MDMRGQLILKTLLLKKAYLLTVFSVSVFTTFSLFPDTTIQTLDAATFDALENNENKGFQFTSLTNDTRPPEQEDDALVPRVLKITEGVYSAIGYGPANINMIEGDNEIVIVDSGSSIESAKIVLDEFRKISNKPISSVIYTNSNPDHIWGAEVFAKEVEKNNVTVIAQASIMDKFYSFQVAAKQKSLYNLFWSGILLPNNDSEDLSNYNFGSNWKLGNVSFVKPTLLFDQILNVTYGGINMTLVHSPAQCADNIYIWLPKKEVLLSGDSIYKAFPLIYNMRSNTDTDVLQWINGLDKMIMLNATYLLPSHSLPVTGKENVTDLLTSYRDGISYVFQQTARYINKGYGPEEIVQLLELPNSLKEHPWLQEKSGHISWQVRYLYDKVMGWNTGDSTWFDPVSQQERGNKIVEGFGGLNKTIDNARQALTKGEYHWTAELATYILNAYPDNQNAKSLKAQALRNIGAQDSAFGASNWYRTQADVLDGLINRSSITNQSKTNLLEEVVSKVPVNTVISQLQYKLDPTKSNDTNIVFGIYLNDTGEGYTLEVSNSVVHYKESFPETYDVAISTDEKTLKDTLLGRLRFVDAVESHKIIVYGNPIYLINLAKSFDLKLVVPIFTEFSGN